VRLDHLLSREYQVETLGVVSALLAPRLIAAIDTSLSPGESGAGLRVGEIDGGLAQAPIPLEYKRNSCHSSRVKGAPRGDRRSLVGTARRATSSAG
jgi:hypothetical protein